MFVIHIMATRKFLDWCKNHLLGHLKHSSGQQTVLTGAHSSLTIATIQCFVLQSRLVTVDPHTERIQKVISCFWCIWACCVAPYLGHKKVNKV